MAQDRRRLTLDCQRKVGRKAITELGVSEDVLARLNGCLQRKEVVEPPPEPPPNSDGCMTCVPGQPSDDVESPECEVTAQEAIIPPMTTVKDLLLANWSKIESDPEFQVADLSAVNRCLSVWNLECGSHIEYLPDLILTVRMQDLLECHITEIGISARTAEALEEYASVTCLNQLLRLHWNEMERFAGPAADGGIPNFGDKALVEIKRCLRQAGFVCKPGTLWVKEQNTEEYLARHGRGRLTSLAQGS